MIEMYDNIAAPLITVDATKRTRDGYLAAEARVARTGIQIYGGEEVGRPDLAFVRVYRPEDEVFSEKTMRTLAHRPITDDHPSEPVTAKNWKRLSRGHTGDEVIRDGRFVRVPMLLMDEGVIQKWEDGKRELSMGYVCDLKWESGVSPDGEEYDAVQRDISYNHLALVNKARGGADLRVGDEEFEEADDDEEFEAEEFQDEDVLEMVEDEGFDELLDDLFEVIDFNQMHRPKGSPQGGQFAPKGGGESGSTSSSSSSNARSQLQRERQKLANTNDPNARAHIAQTIKQLLNHLAHEASALGREPNQPSASKEHDKPDKPEKQHAMKTGRVAQQQVKAERVAKQQRQSHPRENTGRARHEPQQNERKTKGKQYKFKTQTPLTQKFGKVVTTATKKLKKKKIKKKDGFDFEDVQMKTCPECGYRMPATAKECPECGYEMVNDSADPDHTADDLDNVVDSEGEALMRMTVDGISMEINDKDAQIIQRALEMKDAKVKELTDKASQDAQSITKAANEAAALQTQLSTKDAEIVTLKKQVEDNKLSPQQIDAMVSQRAETVTKAKAMLGDKLIVKDKTEADIRRQVVDAQLGDRAKGWSDEQVSISFDTLIGTTKLVGDGVRKLASAFDHQPAAGDQNVIDKAHDAYEKRLTGAYRKADVAA